MSDFSSLFKDTPAVESEFKTIPEGTYSALVGSATIDITKTPMRISLTLVMADEEYKGRKLFKNYTLNAQGIGYLKKDLKSMEADYSEVERPEDLCKVMNSKEGTGLEVYVKPKEHEGKVYSSVYINGTASIKPKDEFGF